MINEPYLAAVGYCCRRLVTITTLQQYKPLLSRTKLKNALVVRCPPNKPVDVYIASCFFFTFLTHVPNRWRVLLVNFVDSWKVTNIKSTIKNRKQFKDLLDCKYVIFVFDVRFYPPLLQRHLNHFHKSCSICNCIVILMLLITIRFYSKL